MRASELMLLALLSACTAGDDVPAPQIAAVTPDHAPSGTVIGISGSYFCQAPAIENDVPCNVSGAVLFGTVPGVATQWSDTEIMVEVPDGLTMPVPVRVQAGGHTSNAVTFTPG